MHGVYLGLMNGFWVTAWYVADDILLGAASGLVIGVLALIASKVLKPRPEAS